jgi:hypothetical protein
MKRVAQVALCASLVLFASVACSKSEREVCNALPFEIYQDDVGPDGIGTATVRMVPRDVNLPGFICVATRIRQEHPGWRQVRVGLFDDAQSAEHYDFDWMGSDLSLSLDRAWEMDKRATYVLNLATHEEYVLLRMLWGYGPQNEGYESRIDLPVKGRPQCRFEIKDRCLVAMEIPVHVEAPDGYFPEGTVTVSGWITSEGTLSDLRADVLKDETSRANEWMTRIALDILSTWRLDPAPRQDSIRVSLRFVIDRTSSWGRTSVELSSPTSLTISHGLR